MRTTFGDRQIFLTQGDITQQHADAIVNAANSRLAGGGGVDGAIHRAGRLSARFVIHAVGPVYAGGGRGEETLLASAYRASFDLATEHECRSIALPALSTGAYRYPLEEAAQIALLTTCEFFNRVDQGEGPEAVSFVLFSTDVMQTFEACLHQLANG